MIVNSERNMTPIGRRAKGAARLRARLRESLKREPSHAELAKKLRYIIPSTLGSQVDSPGQ
jgi:hypothetical protein